MLHLKHVQRRHQPTTFAQIDRVRRTETRQMTAAAATLALKHARTSFAAVSRLATVLAHQIRTDMTGRMIRSLDATLVAAERVTVQTTTPAAVTQLEDYHRGQRFALLAEVDRIGRTPGLNMATPLTGFAWNHARTALIGVTLPGK